MNLKLLSSFLASFAFLFLPASLYSQADLGITNTAAINVSPNRNLVFTMQVVNFGPEVAPNVQLTANLPAGSVFVSFNAPPGWSVTIPPVGSNTPVRASRPNLSPGEVQTLTLVLVVGNIYPIGTTISTTAFIESAVTDPNPGNNQAQAFSTLAAALQFDLSVVKRGFPLITSRVGVVYTIQVVNNGANPQTSVSLADIIPPGTTLKAFIAPPGWTTSTPVPGLNGILTARTPSLFPGQAAAFTLIVDLDSSYPIGSTISNTASVTSASLDLSPLNNLATFTARLVSPLPADLSIVKSGQPTVSPGGTITYLLSVKNNGPYDAQNVIVSDALQGTTFVSLLSSPGWAASTPTPGTSGVVQISTPSIANGAGATFTLVAKTADNAVINSTINNSASITGANVDPVTANNSSLVGTVVSPGSTACTIICPPNIVTSNTAGQCGAVVSYPAPSITGNCGSVTSVPASGSFFPIGTTTVRVTASSGQICSFTVRVNDTQSPTIVSCPQPPIFCGNASGTYTIPRLVATDNCNTGGISFVISGATNRSGTGDNASGQFNPGSSTITWTVRDSSNNTATCRTNVTVNRPFTVGIPDAAVLSTGVNVNTVYTGYAPASAIKLNADVTGGTPPFTYLWSNGATTASIKVSPSVTTAYRVTVTDSLGCRQVSQEKLVKVVDVRCGPRGDRVQVCIVPPGKLGNPFNSCIDAGSVAYLLKSGARLGNCNVAQDFTISMKATPNPTNTYFTVSVTSGNTIDKITLNIYSSSGKFIESRTMAANASVRIGSSYPNGIYFAEAVQGTKKATLVLIKL